MKDLLNQLDEIFDIFVEYCVLIVEMIGVAVLLFAVGKAVWMLLSRRTGVRLSLAEGIALSLEFKMGGELLRTVIVRGWNELLILGSIILIRAAMAFLSQWEISNQKKASLLPPDGRDRKKTDKPD